MGRTKSLTSDTEVRNKLENLPKNCEFVNKLSKSPTDKVYVMSDADDIIASARNQTFSDRLLMVPGTIVHVDKQDGQKTERLCEGFEKLVLEHHLLMKCDFLVRGHSGLSVIASAIGGTYKDL